jgi:hypothetical protein
MESFVPRAKGGRRFVAGALAAGASLVLLGALLVGGRAAAATGGGETVEPATGERPVPLAASAAMTETPLVEGGLRPFGLPQQAVQDLDPGEPLSNSFSIDFYVSSQYSGAESGFTGF